MKMKIIWLKIQLDISSEHDLLHEQLIGFGVRIDCMEKLTCMMYRVSQNM